MGTHDIEFNQLREILQQQQKQFEEAQLKLIESPTQRLHIQAAAASTDRIRKTVGPVQVNPQLRSYVNKLQGGGVWRNSTQIPLCRSQSGAATAEKRISRKIGEKLGRLPKWPNRAFSDVRASKVSPSVRSHPISEQTEHAFASKASFYFVPFLAHAMSKASLLTTVKEVSETPLSLFHKLARRHHIRINWNLVDEYGAPHSRMFLVKLTIFTEGSQQPEVFEAVGRNIQAAKQSVATTVLENSPFFKSLLATDGRRQRPRDEKYQCFRNLIDDVPSARGPRNDILELTRVINVPVKFLKLHGSPTLTAMCDQKSPVAMYRVALEMAGRQYVGESTSITGAEQEASVAALKAIRRVLTSSATFVDSEHLRPSQLGQRLHVRPTNPIWKLQLLVGLHHERPLFRTFWTPVDDTLEEPYCAAKAFYQCICSVPSLGTVECIGKSKAMARTSAAKLMLDRLIQRSAHDKPEYQNHPTPLPSRPSVPKPRSKNPSTKARSQFKMDRTNPAYGQDVNPVQRLDYFCLAQALGRPVYVLVHDGTSLSTSPAGRMTSHHVPPEFAYEVSRLSTDLRTNTNPGNTVDAVERLSCVWQISSNLAGGKQHSRGGTTFDGTEPIAKRMRVTGTPHLKAYNTNNTQTRRKLFHSEHFGCLGMGALIVSQPTYNHDFYSAWNERLGYTGKWSTKLLWTLISVVKTSLSSNIVFNDLTYNRFLRFRFLCEVKQFRTLSDALVSTTRFLYAYAENHQYSSVLKESDRVQFQSTLKVKTEHSMKELIVVEFPIIAHVFCCYIETLIRVQLVAQGFQLEIRRLVMITCVSKINSSAPYVGNTIVCKILFRRKARIKSSATQIKRPGLKLAAVVIGTSVDIGR
ncbi:hypothetical protein CLF_107965 [Clonorchis sinensis]|uniref:DRBM domain-containing protein n=1 Tax=Clonorchis sinensis TaxID=79923 RepID=G7YHE7_CLOSI|nr:hypothetical protein CLF_107965 [Clonorchis sinensis]